jgi:hypothetical protein
MRNMIKGTMLCCLASFVGFFIGCAYNMASLKIDKSLPPEKLAQYSDHFDSFRGDLWETDGYIRNASIRTNYKLAELSVENGRLKVETKTGTLSFGGIVSKFYFRGDFDVQMDCYVDLLQDSEDMDQMIAITAFDKTKELEDDKVEGVGLYLNKTHRNSALMVVGYYSKGKTDRRFSKKINDNFRGTFRFVRVRDQITILYTTPGEKEWQKTCSVSRTNPDTWIGMKAQNFFNKRLFADAKLPLVVWFDNFKVNSAQEIVEEDI